VLGGEETSETVEKGVILEQNYPEGHEFEQGETLTGDDQITVIVSSGKEQAAVPDVTYEEFIDAAQTLVNHSFEYLDEYIYDDDTPKDFVVRQEPEAGAMADPGSTVTIYISLGKEIIKVSVPQITGMTEDNAKIALQSKNLQIGTIRYAPSNDFAEGLVARQLTSAGSQINEGQAVDFIVSSGPAPTEEPAPEKEPMPGLEGVDDDGDGMIDEEGEVRTPDETENTDPSADPDSGEETPVVTTKPINVPSREFPEGVESVTVQIMRRTSEGAWVIVENREVNPADLPMDILVSGSGVQFFSVSINGIEVANGAYDFNE
jgi:serine/threonine-protein kinase